MNLIKELGKKVLGSGVVVTIRRGHLRGKRYRLNKYTSLTPLFGAWEKDSQRVFEAFVSSGNVVYDLGANTGIHSLHLSQLVGANGLVYAFEPMPPNVEEIELVVQLNKIENIEIVAKAVSDQSGMFAFAPSHHPKTGSLEFNASSGMTTINVPVVTIDELVASGLRKPDFLKIDIEGGEGAALEGMERTAKEHYPTMYIELHNPTQDLRVGGFLARHGYEAYRLRSEQAIQLCGQVNFLQRIRRLDLGYPEPEGIYSQLVAVHPQRREQWQAQVARLSASS